MPELPARIRSVQATAILLSTTAAGLNLGLSVFMVPSLLESPTSPMVRQWRNMFISGCRFIAFPLIFLPGFLNVSRHIPEKVRLYALAATITLGISPYTEIILRPINKKLNQKASEVESLDLGETGVLAEEEEEEETAHSLVERWGFLNLARGTASFISGAIGLYDAIN